MFLVAVENFKEYYHVLKRVYAENESIDVIQVQLLGVLHQQLKKSDNNHDIENGIYLQVVLTDELFLKKEIEGWENKMLEHQIFNTQNAGERIQNDLQQMIHHPLDYDRNMIYLYFLILSFGFKGKFTESTLKKYKDHLSKMLFPETQPSPYLMAGNFEFTEKKIPTGFVPGIKLWLMIFGGILILYIGITSAYWFGVQKEMQDIVMVLDQKTKMERSDD